MGSVTALTAAAMATDGHLGPATVASVDGSSVWLQLAKGGLRAPCLARIALADRGPLAVGEEVLVVGDADRGLYVIGRLSPTSAVTAPPNTVPEQGRVAFPGGGYAALETEEGSTVLRIHSPRDTLILEYDPAAGRTRLTPEAGDLELVVPAGNLALRAAGSVSIKGGAVAIRSRSAIGLAVEDATGGARSILSLEGGTARLAASSLDVAAVQASLQAEETRYAGRSLLAEVATLRLVAGRVETFARTMVEKTRNLYRVVEELLETRAGRVRSRVDGTYHLKARDAVLRAERDVDLDGEKIRLG